MNLSFDIGMKSSKLGISLTKTEADQRLLLDNEVLWAIVEKNPVNTASDYAEELGVSSTTISHYLKLICKVKKKKDKWVPHELNENH